MRNNEIIKKLDALESKQLDISFIPELLRALAHYYDTANLDVSKSDFACAVGCFANLIDPVLYQQYEELVSIKLNIQGEDNE